VANAPLNDGLCQPLQRQLIEPPWSIEELASLTDYQAAQHVIHYRCPYCQSLLVASTAGLYCAVHDRLFVWGVAGWVLNQSWRALVYSTRWLIDDCCYRNDKPVE
jgi:hypothetical protein